MYQERSSKLTENVNVSKCRYVCCQGRVRPAVNQLATPLRFNLIGRTFVPRIKQRLYISNPKTCVDLSHQNKAQYQQNAFSYHSNRKSNFIRIPPSRRYFRLFFLTCAVTPAGHAYLGALSGTGRLKIMLHLLVCGAAVFPGLFYSFSKVFKVTFKHWSDADVFCVSERFAALTWKMPHLFSFHLKIWLLPFLTSRRFVPTVIWRANLFCFVVDWCQPFMEHSRRQQDSLLWDPAEIRWLTRKRHVLLHIQHTNC